jgi:hypothetical protein
MNTYAYSFDGENYTGSFESREAAAAEAFAENPDAARIRTGRCATPARTPRAYELIEQIGEDATEGSGEWAEGYLDDVSKEAEAELQAELQEVWDRWEAKHHLAPTWYNIEDVVEHWRPTPKEEKTHG